MINNSFGVFSTTEDRCFGFHLKTLELVDEMIDKCQQPKESLGGLSMVILELYQGDYQKI